MTPTQKDIQRIQENYLRLRSLRHSFLYNQKLSPKAKQALGIRITSIRSRITTLIKNINSRFFNSKILEVTYTEDGEKYRMYLTDVLPKDVADYFDILNSLNGYSKHIILEIKEIQDRIKPLPL